MRAMSKKTLNICALAAAVALAASCGDRAHVWESPLALSGPYKVNGQAVWVDGTRGLAVALEPNGAEPRTHRVAIGRNVTFAAPTPDRAELLVLTAGKEAIYKDQTPEVPALTRLLPDNRGLWVKRRFPLPAAFDRLATSADGRYAVAYYAPSSGGSDGLRNPNEVALLDLGADPDSATNPRLKTVTSFGAAPSQVVFSPKMKPAGSKGGERTLALVLADNYVHLFDMNNRARRAITVPLAKPQSATKVVPKEVLFSASTSTIFVQAAGAADVYALTLTPAAAKGKDGNDFSLTVNQPSAGKRVLDMALFSDGGKDTLLTANSSSDLALIDAATSQFSIIDVGEPVDTILLVPQSKPTTALIYSRTAAKGRIHFLELSDLAKNLEKNLTSRNLAKPVRQLVETLDGQQALVIHNDQRTVISILDLAGEHHTVSPIHGSFALASYDFSKGTHLVGISASAPSLGLLNLNTLLATNLRLDHRPVKVLALGDDIVAVHGAAAGHVTVIPGPTAKREQAKVLWGFLLSGLLDDELQD